MTAVHKTSFPIAHTVQHICIREGVTVQMVAVVREELLCQRKNTTKLLHVHLECAHCKKFFTRD